MVAWFRGLLPLSKTLSDGATPHERRFGKPLWANKNFFWTDGGIIIRFLRKARQDSTSLAKRSYQASSLVGCYMPGGIWKTRHYSHGRRGAGTVKRVRNPCSVKLAGRAQLRTSTLTQEHPARGEEHHDVFQGEVGGSLPSDQQTDDTEARFGLWSISGSHIYRHHVQPRVKLYVPEEGSHPRPLKYIDVVRRTNTTLDVLLESRIDDYWNVDGGQELSGPWTVFTQFSILNDNLRTGSDPQKFKQHPGPITCGQRSGQVCQKKSLQQKE